MKARTFVLTVIVAILALAMMAFAFPAAAHALPAVVPAGPQVAAQVEPGDNLTEVQLFIVGAVASLALWLLKLAASRGYKPGKEVVAIALYVVSFGMALLFKAFALPAFPAFSDAPSFVAALLNYVAVLLTLAAPLAGFAYLIYNVLLQRVLEAVKARVAKR